MTPYCQYCKQPAELVGGDVIYPHRPDLAGKKFWHCAPCRAYVGCHPGTTKHLGLLANAELRKLKSHVHTAFDPLWRHHGMTRAQAYLWLAEGLGIDRRQCHVGMFNEERCRAALVFLSSHQSSGTNPGGSSTYIERS
jgi:hypothetical protein